MRINKELLIRDDKLIKSLLVYTKDGINIKEKLYMVYPDRYNNIGLTRIGVNIEVTGVAMLMTESKKYSVITIPNMIEVLPASIDNTTVDDEDYVVMTFLPNKFVSSITTTDDADIPVTLFEEFVQLGKIPFFMDTGDLLKTFNKTNITTSSSVFGSSIIVELLLALISRTKDGKLARQKLNKEEMTSDNIKYIGISKVEGYLNNTSRIIGSYFGNGLTAALNDDDPVDTDMDDILSQ